jgi:YVTN family beta-propeller protein
LSRAPRAVRLIRPSPNTATNKPGPAIKVGANPAMIAITPNGHTAYVTDSGSAQVTPITTATNKPGPAIRVGHDPVEIAIIP